MKKKIIDMKILNLTKLDIKMRKIIKDNDFTHI